MCSPAVAEIARAVFVIRATPVLTLAGLAGAFLFVQTPALLMRVFALGHARRLAMRQQISAILLIQLSPLQR